MARKIDVNDVGPVQHISIALPDAGGVVVLRGKNGSGKTHTLRAVECLLDGEERPVSRDGSVGARIEGLGARLTVGRRATREGAIEVRHLEGADPSQVVDPGFDDPLVADKHRIRVLCRLAHLEATPEMFASLKMPEAYSAAALKCDVDDLPDFAAAYKREAEAVARAAEAEEIRHAARADGHYAAARSTAETALGRAVEHSDVLDPEFCSGAFEDLAVAEKRAAHCAQLLGQASGAIQEAERQAGARKALTRQLENALKLLQNADPKEELAKAQKLHALDERLAAEHEALRAQVVMATDALRNAQEAERAMGVQRRENSTRISEISQRVERMKKDQVEVVGLRAQLKATDDSADSEALDADLAAAVDANEKAVAARLRAAMGVQFHQSLTAANSCIEQGALVGARARHARAAATGVDDVVTHALAQRTTGVLRVQADRLYANVGKHEWELFDRLSAGERWRITIEIAVTAIGTGGVLVVMQEAWEGLDPTNRSMVAELAREHGIVIVTAEADDGEIRSEEFVPASAPVAAKKSVKKAKMDGLK